MYIREGKMPPQGAARMSRRPDLSTARRSSADLLVMFQEMQTIARAEAARETKGVLKYTSQKGIHLTLDLRVLKLCREKHHKISQGFVRTSYMDTASTSISDRRRHPSISLVAAED